MFLFSQFWEYANVYQVLKHLKSEEKNLNSKTSCVRNKTQGEILKTSLFLSYMQIRDQAGEVTLTV